MAVKLTWRQWWTPDADQNIYRHTQDFTRDNLPVALATVAAGITTYDDATAAEGDVYWYAVGASLNGVEVVSKAVRVISGAGGGGGGPAYVDIVARYWRLNHFASAGRARAAECLFLDELGAKLPATASASSHRYLNYASRAYEEQPYSTETGDSNRYWQAATGDNVNAWFAIDLGEGNDARVDGIYIWTTDPYAPVSGFTELEYSHDGVTWVSLGTITHEITWGGTVEGTIDVSDLTRTAL